MSVFVEEQQLSPEKGNTIENITSQENIVGYHGSLTTLIQLAKVLLNNLRQLC